MQHVEQPQTYLIERKVSFFALHIPLKEKIKMEMAVFGKESENSQDTDIIWYELIPNNLNTQIPELGNLKLFSLSLPVFDDPGKKKSSFIIKEKGKEKRVEFYKIRISCDYRDSRNPYCYYEKPSSPRKLGRMTNIFIFDLLILRNEDYFRAKEPPSKSVYDFLEQSFFFAISLIETGNIDKLEDFHEQHRKYSGKKSYSFKEPECRKAFEYLQKYFETKDIKRIDDFNILTAVASMFSLLPVNEPMFLEYTPHQFFDIIKTFENHLENLLSLDLDSNIFRILSNGLSFLFLAEELKRDTSNWVKLIKQTSQDFASVFTYNTISRAYAGRISIRYESIKELRNCTDNILSLDPMILSLAYSLPEFVKLTKDFTSARLKEIMNNESDTRRIENTKEDIKNQISHIFEEYLNNNPNWKEKIDIEVIADFMYEVAENSEYLNNIFLEHQSFCQALCSTLKSASFHTGHSLDILYKILGDYYNGTLLCDSDLYIPRYLKQILSSNHKKIQDIDYYIKFFTFFMLRTDFTFSEFEEILSCWIKNIRNKKELIEYLDTLCHLFKGDSPIAKSAAPVLNLKKRDLLIKTIISNFKANTFKEKVEYFIKNVKLKEPKGYFLQIMCEEIQSEHLPHLQIKNSKNPLLILNSLFQKYNQDPLIEQLINFCLSQIPSISREQALTSLFLEPSDTSLVSMIILEDVFKNTQVRENLSEVCNSILKDMQTCNLELKWIIGASEPKLEPTFEIFDRVIDEDFQRGRMSKERPDVRLLIKNYKEQWNSQIAKINSLGSFIGKYCEQANDVETYVDILQNIKKNVNEKRLSDLIPPSELDVLLPYVQKLEPFYHSVSFKKFRVKMSEKSRATNCKGEAARAVKMLDQFKNTLDSSIDDPKITVRQIYEWFVDVKDLEAEGKILSIILDERKNAHLFEILHLVKNLETTIKICKGFLACIKTFKLTCSLTAEIENGCNLSLDEPIKSFYGKNKTIHECLDLGEGGDLYQILETFGEEHELLTFTTERSQSEIDNMIESVNDYEESQISTQTIFDFANLWSYITGLCSKVYKKTTEFFLTEAKALLQNNSYSEVVSNILTVKSNLQAIQNLHFELNHKEEAKRKQIFKIVDQASIKIVNTKKKFDLEIEHTIEGLLIKQEDIFELRDRARLIAYTEQNKIDNKEAQIIKKEELEKINIFCSRVDLLEQLLRLLDKLKLQGHPDFLTGEDLKVKCGFYYREGELDQLGSFKSYLEGVLEAWNNVILDSYRKYYELTYLKGKDFWKVRIALQDPTNEQNIKGLNLLHYIGKEPIMAKIAQNSPEDRLNDLGRLLKSLATKVKKKIDQVTEKLWTYYIIEVSEKAMIKGLMSLYLKFENTIPEAYQLLICHNSTLYNELVAFAYRCFFNPENKLFCLVQPERLSFALQDQFSSFIKNFIHNYPDKKFYLGFVTTDMQVHVITSLRTKESTKIFKIEELVSYKEIVATITGVAKHCMVVASNITGLGKTTFIKNFGQECDLECRKVPISGVINPQEIGKRLLKPILRANSILWFTVGSIEESDKSLLNEILFSLIVLRCFHDSHNVVVVPEDLFIFVEIDSSYFENLGEEIEILSYLKTEHIEQMEWEKLDYLSPKIQFVCYYLKSLDEGTIGTTDCMEEDLATKRISKESCCSLLQKEFRMHLATKRPSYTQLSIFVNVLYSLLKSFSTSGYFLYNVLSKNGNQTRINQNSGSLSKFVSLIASKLKKIEFMDDEEIKMMRKSLTEVLILTAFQFTSNSVQNVRSESNFSRSYVLEKANQIFTKAVVSWENFNPFVLLFTSDSYPIFIYKELKNIPEPIMKAIKYQITALASFDRLQKANFLADYKNLSQKELFERLVLITRDNPSQEICFACFTRYQGESCPICKNVKSNIKETTTQGLNFKNYVLTLDNFIKMVLIFVKAQQKIPVIIMGETGCGKTSLIKYLCTNVLDDGFRIFSIHAGIGEADIVERMTMYQKDAEELGNSKRLWIFFDEFNTTGSIGLLKEIICERTLLGKPLPENLIFSAACNPWRLRSNKLSFENEKVGLKKKKNESNLIYTVYPLPESMIDYIWDYGSLEKDTEKKYIEAMLKALEVDGDLELIRVMVDLVSAAHQKFKTWEDVSSVSLRDCSRFKIIFEWFVGSLSSRRRREPAKEKSIIYRDAAILALIHCYYLRISSQEKRSNFLIELEFHTKKLSMNKKDIERLVYEEEMDFLRRMEPLPGIALNNALRENVFALIVCVCTKTPIFICGKPGCSKSLSIQLVFTHLRGNNSQDSYFRTLPELIPVTYQGSEYCTSKSIEKVFEKAEKYLNVKTTNLEKKKEILPVIVFDEIGLAENSENNPLKVLHSKLEIEDIKVGFIGVSNWRLDASKMNRALYLARVDPDITDLISTAEAIFNNTSSNAGISLSEGVIRGLARIYWELHDDAYVKQKENVYGLRDYYSLIKGISSDLVLIKEQNLIDDVQAALYIVIKQNIKKNFSALGNEYLSLWKKFCQYTNRSEEIFRTPEVSVHDLIINKLKRKEGRYLMLITQNDCISEYIEELILKNYQLNQNNSNQEKSDKEVRILTGSQMVDDLKNASYGYRTLSQIILYLEKGNTLIFRKMDHLYSSLYDLFNQDFSQSGKRRYCRIALGILHNPKCIVHSSFNCIVFITEAEMKKADPPFLNRFEKYKIKVENLLSYSENLICKDFVDWVNSFTTSTNEADRVKPELIFMNYNPETPFSLIIQTKNEISGRKEFVDEEKILQISKQRLVQTASFDFAIFVSLIQDKEYRNQLLDMYYQTKSKSFRDFCTEVLSQKDQNNKFIIYTYSQMSEDIKYTHKDVNSVKELKLGNLRSEAEINEEIKKWLGSQNEGLLVVRVELLTESIHLLFLKNLLVNSLNTAKAGKGLHLMIIIHLQRFNIGSKKTQIDTMFQGWESMMFDSLNDDYLIPIEYMDQPEFNKLTSLKLLPSIDMLLENLFDKCLSKMRYNVELEEQVEKSNTRRNEILRNLKENSYELFGLMNSKICKKLHKVKADLGFEDWRSYINDNEWIRATAISPLEAIRLGITKYYENFVMNILYVLEKDYLLDSYFHAKKTKNSILLELWCNNFENLDFKINWGLSDGVEVINFIFGLNFPFSSHEHVRIRQIQEEAEDLQKEHEKSLVNKISFDKLLDSSFFGSAFSSKILTDEGLFDMYFKDQLGIYLRTNKQDLKLETVLTILDCMFVHDKDLKFKYFLSNTRKLTLILQTVEAISSLDQGEKVVEKCLNSVYDLEKTSLNEILGKTVLNRILVCTRGLYYNLDQKSLSELLNETTTFEEIKSDESDQPFIYFFFESVIQEISTCRYLLNYESIQSIKSGFKLVEERIIRTRFRPGNLEAFRPWIDLIQFVESCDRDPNLRFNEVVTLLQPHEKNGLFCTYESVEDVINYFKQRTVMVNGLDEKELDNKIKKLQNQLYKNLISYNETFISKTLRLIDDDPDLWKSSAKVIDLVDHYTCFSFSIQETEGQIRDLQNDQNLQELENLLNKVSFKIHNILVNKAFFIFEGEWYDCYKDILIEKKNKFLENLVFFKNAVSTQVPMVSLLGVIVWLKAFLYCYAIALEKEVDKESPEVFLEIDQALREEAIWLSTLKIYVIKTLKQKFNKSLTKLRREYMQRTVGWIIPLLRDDSVQTTKLNVVLPTCFDRTPEIDELLNNIYSLEENLMPTFLKKCLEAQSDYSLSMSIYSWFLRFYVNYSQEGFKPPEDFIIIMKKHQEALIKSFGEAGCELLFLLLDNFHEGSFFHLKVNMKNAEIYEKVVALDVLIGFISQQFLDTSFSSIIFENKQLQKNISAHLSNRCLYGQLESNFLIENMKDVKKNVTKRLMQNQIYSDAKFIYKCSQECDYFFYFGNCGRPNSKDICPECRKDIGASSHGILLIRNGGPQEQQIIYSIEEGFKEIDRKLKIFEEQPKKGYLINLHEQNAKIDTKKDLKPITFRTLHFLLHTLFFGLIETGLIPSEEFSSAVGPGISGEEKQYFKKHFLQDLKMIGQLIQNPECYVWIYKIISDLKVLSDEKNSLTDSDRLARFERRFENEVINSAIGSSLVKRHQQEYLEERKGDENDENIISYINEIKLNQEKYPYLQYFNCLDLPSFRGFSHQFSLLMSNNRGYPLLKFVLEKYEQLSNVSALPIIVSFTNSLIRELNYRISREKAASTPIKSLFENRPQLEREFFEFKEHWNRINLKTVYVGCHSKEFRKITENDSLSLFLPNLQKDESGILLVGTMIALANIQNKFIYFVRMNMNPNKSIERIIEEERENIEIIQKVKPDDIIDISSKRILKEIAENGYMHNYAYGKGNDIIYDFEEIENRLYQQTNKKKLLNNEKFMQMNYQFELYPQSSSIITDLRIRNPQEPFLQDQKIKFRNLLKQLSKKELVDYLGSLDYIFTYLCNVKENGNKTIEEFCQSCILNYKHLNEFVRRDPHCKVQLKNILDLYELVEEVVFEEAIEEEIGPRFVKDIPEEEQKNVIQMFSQATLKNTEESPTSILKNAEALAKVFKKIILRGLASEHNLENRLLDYFVREDIWNQDVDMNQINSVELDDNIKLKHSYIILKYLEQPKYSMDILQISSRNNVNMERDEEDEYRQTQRDLNSVRNRGKPRDRRIN